MTTEEKFEHIQGWGSDLAHENRPAYPKERHPPRLENVHWDHPEQQVQTIEVFHSTERPGLTPVFGTSAPPSGISGSIRRAAYKFSENDVRHWLMLLFADRVNMFEGIADDLAHGHIPNFFAEMGGKAELAHNREGALRKALVVASVAGVTWLVLHKRRNAYRQPYRARR
ncbi:MAG: hypothetical protein V4731_07470 [Pseudomonadota bacterium]